MSSVSGSRTSSVSQPPFPYFQDAVRIVVQQIGEETFSKDPDPNPNPNATDKDSPSENKENGPSSAMTASTTSIDQPGVVASRRFSVDPQLTNFDILKNLVARAFDMKGDFAISYRAFDDFGQEAYLPLVSDWDLGAAFTSASDPDLKLVIEPKNIPLELEDEDPWDIIKSSEMIPESSHLGKPNGTAMPRYSSNGDSQNGFSASGSRVLSAMSQLGNQYPISLNSKINTAGIFNTMEKWVQKAKTFVEDLSVVTSRPPLSDIEFRNYLDPGGVLCRPRELRYACYHGGIEPGLRKVVWKHLLNIYPDGLSGNARMEYVRSKAKEYYELRDAWKGGVESGKVSDEFLCVSNMVRKDVLRTDRHLQFYAGQDDNPNVALLFNILTTYALNHPTVGYCQGMSDLASPLLYTMGDEAQAYLCFCALMDRIKPSFNCDGLSMSAKFTHLSEALAYYDPTFWSYLKSIGADDLLFCYRWLLLEMKREFAFEDALRMMEVMWSSLPYKPQDVPLFEVKFSLDKVHPTPIPVPTLTASYSRVCAIRRSSSSAGSKEGIMIRGRRISRKPKPNPLSLDESSLSSMSSIVSSASGRSIPGHSKPFHSLDETTELLTSSLEISTGSRRERPCSPDFLSKSLPPIHFKKSPHPKPKMIKNLKEFYKIVGEKGENLSSPDSEVNPSSIHEQEEAELNGQVFYDNEEEEDPESPLTASTNSNNSNCTTFPFSTQGQDQRSRNSSGKSVIDNLNSHRTYPTSAPTTTRNSSLSLYENQNQNQIIENENLIIKSDNGKSGKSLKSEGSDHDSGHCFEDSLELFDSASLTEPEFSRDLTSLTRPLMPSPEVLGGGNPFLIFLSLTILLQHRDHIIRNGMDYNETAMYFDKYLRKHKVERVLAHARILYSEYLKKNVAKA